MKSRRLIEITLIIFLICDVLIIPASEAQVSIAGYSFLIMLWAASLFYSPPRRNLLRIIFPKREADESSSLHGLKRIRQIIKSYRKRHVFMVCVFSLLAKLIKTGNADPEVKGQALEDYIRNVLQFTEKQSDSASMIFDMAYFDDRSFASYAEEFYSYFSREPAMMVNLVDILLAIASADGRISPREEQLVSWAACRFGFSKSIYSRMRAVYLTGAKDSDWINWSAYQQRPSEPEEVISSELDRKLAILNCRQDSSDQEIRSNYRKLVREHHPDFAIAQGMPQEFIHYATQRFRQIQEAYEQVRQARGF